MNNPIDAEALDEAFAKSSNVWDVHARSRAAELIARYLDALPPTDGYARGAAALKKIKDAAANAIGAGTHDRFSLIAWIAETAERALSPAVGMGEAIPRELFHNTDMTLSDGVMTIVFQDDEPAQALFKALSEDSALLAPIQARDEDRKSGDLLAIEALAQWLHDEVEWPDPDFPNFSWPEHPDDTGQRENGWLKIVPKDTAAQFRSIARRLLSALSKRAGEITR